MRSYLLVIKTVLESDCTPNNFRATLGEKPGDDTAALAFHPLQMPKIHMFGVLQKTGRTQRTKKLVESHRLQALSACTALEKCFRPDSCLQLRRVTSQTGVVRKHMPNEKLISCDCKARRRWTGSRHGPRSFKHYATSLTPVPLCSAAHPPLQSCSSLRQSPKSRPRRPPWLRRPRSNTRSARRPSPSHQRSRSS